MSVCVDANITGTFRNYKLLQRILQNFNAGGLLSGVGIFSGLLSGGLMSGGLLSLHRISYLGWFVKFVENLLIYR